MNNQTTGALIQNLRKEKKLTQKELAQRLHVTDQAVSKWERGLCAPDIALLEPLAQALDTTVLELVSGTRTEPQVYAEPIESAVKEVLQYSEREIARKGKTMRKQSLLAGLGVCLALHPCLAVCAWLRRGTGALRQRGDRAIHRQCRRRV